MANQPDSGDLRGQLENALAVLGATPANDVRAVRQTFELLKNTLQAASAGFDDLEAQLDVVTGPERNAAKDVVALEKQLRDAMGKIAGLEQKLAMAIAGQKAEQELRSSERKRLAELEKKTRDFEDIVATDHDAFAKYFEKALDADEKRGRRPPKR